MSKYVQHCVLCTKNENDKKFLFLLLNKKLSFFWMPSPISSAERKINCWNNLSCLWQCFLNHLPTQRFHPTDLNFWIGNFFKTLQLLWEWSVLFEVFAIFWIVMTPREDSSSPPSPAFYRKGLVPRSGRGLSWIGHYKLEPSRRRGIVQSTISSRQIGTILEQWEFCGKYWFTVNLNIALHC